MLEKFKGETEQAQVVRFVCALGRVRWVMEKDTKKEA